MRVEIDEKLYRHLKQCKHDIEKDLAELTKPPRRYYMRVNTALISIDELINRLRSRGMEIHRDEEVPEAVWVPVKGPFKVPHATKVIVAEKMAAESVMMGANLYAPGVLKVPQPVKPGDEVNVVAPDGTVVAYGIVETDPDTAARIGRGVIVRVLRSIWEAPKVRELPEYQQGLIYDQSLPSIYVGHLTRNLPITKVLDMNAAPGGKASHQAQLGRKVVAIDRPGKARKLLETENRLRLAIDVLAGDSRYVDRDLPRLAKWPDLVLVDPPCTDLGVRPKIIFHKRFSDAESTAKYQEQFLSTALRLTRRYVVYSTCTMTCIENEYIIKRMIRSGKARVVEVDVKRPSPGIDGLGYRFWPSIHDTPGFYIAVLEVTR